MSKNTKIRTRKTFNFILWYHYKIFYRLHYHFSQEIVTSSLYQIESHVSRLTHISSWFVTVGQRKKVPGNCSYLLPRAAAAGSNGTNKGQIRKVPVDEIVWFLVYRMDVTRSQLSANTGILMSLVREIWQFKVFTGKEVTPLHEEGNS